MLACIARVLHWVRRFQNRPQGTSEDARAGGGCQFARVRFSGAYKFAFSKPVTSDVASGKHFHSSIGC